MNPLIDSAPPCTWCGHAVHGPECPRQITVAAGPSGGPGRPVPVKQVRCPCGKGRS